MSHLQFQGVIPQKLGWTHLFNHFMTFNWIRKGGTKSRMSADWHSMPNRLYINAVEAIAT
jgi:hypothetical protein